MKNRLLILTLCIIFFSCHHNSEKRSSGFFSREFSEYFEENERLTSTIFINEKEGLMAYDLKIVDDSLLIMFNPGKDFLYDLVNLRTRQRMFRFGKIGNGPGEFTVPTQFSFGTGNSHDIGIYNKRLFGYTELKLDSLMLNPEYIPQANFHNFDFNHYGLFRVNDDTFLGLGYFKNRYVLSGQTGNIISSTGKYPFQDELGEFTTNQLAYAYQGTLAFHPDGKKFVFATHSSANFEIAEVVDDSVVVHFISHMEKPIFSTSDPEGYDVDFDPESNIGYVDAKATEKYIYLLYFGNSRKDIVDKGLDGARNIFVFDWDGNPIKNFTLDIGLSNIDVWKDSLIIGFNNKEVPHVYQLELSW